MPQLPWQRQVRDAAANSEIYVTLITAVTNSLAQHFSQQCFSDICYSLNIPEDTARSGDGNIYFQISGPTSYSWIGLGQGTQMAGANIFVIYSDGKGNVTLSPRHGLGQFMPEHDTTANVTLLEGSGVKGDKMVANIMCSNCHRWNGGSTSFTGSTGDWIHASRPGDPLDSTDVDETIEQHSDHAPFTWNYSPAQGGQDVNPFVAETSKGGVSTPPPASSGGSSLDNDDDVAVISETMIRAHGTLASIVFLVLFPIGAMTVRMPGLNLPIWVHAGIQIFTYCCFVAAAGLGIYLATNLALLTNHHPIIGMILLGLLFVQPFFGLLHHSAYKKKQKRTLVSYVHIWGGRLMIILGMINGGLGIQLVGDITMGYKIAYGVVAGIMGLCYLITVVFGEVKRKEKTFPRESREEKEAREAMNRAV